jgi:hypothetical protein
MWRLPIIVSLFQGIPNLPSARKPESVMLHIDDSRPAESWQIMHFLGKSTAHNLRSEI